MGAAGKPSAVRDRSESVDTAGRSGKTSCIAPGTGTPCCKSARSGRKRFQSRTHPGAIPRRSQASDFGALRPEFPYGFQNSCRLTKLLVRNFDVEVSAQKKVFHCMHNPVHANLYFRALLDFVRESFCLTKDTERQCPILVPGFQRFLHGDVTFSLHSRSGAHRRQLSWDVRLCHGTRQSRPGGQGESKRENRA